jgi:hypothetical protein
MEQLTAFDVLMVPIFWGTLLGLAAGWVFLTLMNAVERLVRFVARLGRAIRARARAAQDARHRAPRPARRMSHPKVYV